MAGYGAGALELRFELEGEVQVRRRFTGVMTRMTSLKPAFERIAKDFRAHMAEVFDTEGGATKSGRWERLSDRYGAWKARHYPGMPILQRGDRKSGRGPLLMPSLTQEGHPYAVLDLTEDSLAIGTRVPYAVYHQSRLPRKRLPRRAFIDLPESVRARWIQILGDYLWQER